MIILYFATFISTHKHTLISPPISPQHTYFAQRFRTHFTPINLYTPRFGACMAVSDISDVISDFRGGLAHSFSAEILCGFFFGCGTCRTASYGGWQLTK